MPLKDKLREKPFFGAAIAVQEGYKEDAGAQLAGGIAFFGFLSLFPLMLVALSLTGFFLQGNAEVQADVAGKIVAAVPGLGAALRETINDIIAHRRATGIIGFLLLLYSGLRVIDATSVATSKIMGSYRPQESFLVAKGRDLMALVALGGVALVGVSAGWVAGWDLEGNPLQYVVTAIGLLVSFLLDIALFAVAYRTLAARPGPRWRDVLPGAILGAIGWTALKVVGSTYVEGQVQSSNALYGSLGSIIAALVLLYLAARLYVYGAELNATRLERKGDPIVPVEGEPADVEDRSDPNAVAAAARMQAHEDGDGVTAMPRLLDVSSDPDAATPSPPPRPQPAEVLAVVPSAATTPLANTNGHGKWASVRPALALIATAGTLAAVAGRSRSGSRARRKKKK